MVDIWEKGQTFPLQMLTSFKEKLNAPSQSKTTSIPRQTSCFILILALFSQMNQPPLQEVHQQIFSETLDCSNPLRQRQFRLQPRLTHPRYWKRSPTWPASRTLLLLHRFQIPNQRITNSLYQMRRIILLSLLLP